MDSKHSDPVTDEAISVSMHGHAADALESAGFPCVCAITKVHLATSNDATALWAPDDDTQNPGGVWLIVSAAQFSHWRQQTAYASHGATAVFNVCRGTGKPATVYRRIGSETRRSMATGSSWRS
ncbi:MAG: hypothetical protein JKY23_00310 [Nitrospinaceae bacterium]|nr:hypothetical protein [Nitrospinaceae bacterium]